MQNDYERIQAELTDHYAWDQEGPVETFVPNRIDIEVTDQCINNCRGCINLKPKQKGVKPELIEFTHAIDKLEEYSSSDRITEVVVTGGEPLIRRRLSSLIDGLHDREIVTGLSTTGFDPFNQLPEMLGKLDGIGIPVDGPTPEINAVWRGRGRGDGGLELAVKALRLVQLKRPDIETKVRTLVHPRNIDSVNEIPEFLTQAGIDISNLRWILYEQYLRTGTADGASKLLPAGTVTGSRLGLEGFKTSTAESGAGFKEVTVKTLADVAFKYFMINPYGDCRVMSRTTTDPDDENFGEVSETLIGNAISDPAEVIIGFNTLNPNTIAHMSVDAYSYFYQGAEEDEGGSFDW